MFDLRKIVLVGLALTMSIGVSFSQEEEGVVNPNSMLNIPKYEHLYKVRVWRDIDLREKQNKGFFAKGNEISNLILRAINSGELVDIYKKDSLTTKISKEDFGKKMIATQGEVFANWVPASDYYQGDKITFNGQNYEAAVNSKGKNPGSSPNEWEKTTAGQAVLFRGEDIYKYQLVEDVIFDKRRSRLYYDMQAFGLFVFDQGTGTYIELGWLKYKDLDKLFRNHVKEAVWFNRYNTAENKNYADAFLLRLFHGVLIKVENPDDNFIRDTYAGRPYKEAVWAMEQEEMKMMEKEHNLWEY